jgi:hypothetical protein
VTIISSMTVTNCMPPTSMGNVAGSGATTVCCAVP